MIKSMNSSGIVELQITGASAIYDGVHLTYYVCSSTATAEFESEGVCHFRVTDN